MKKLLSLALVLTLALAVCLPAATAEAKDNWLHIFLTSDPETLDVQLTTDSYTIPLNCFDRLVETDTVDGEAQIVPGLADSWDVSEDGLTYTFHLHEGVTFHNGDPFTADDVVYTVNRMMDPATLAKNTDIYYGIVAGAADFYDGKAEGVSGVQALDDLTVQFTLETAYAPFLSCLATPGGSIFNRESTEGVQDFGVNPDVCFGTGPFQVTEWELGSKVTLKANPNYFKGAPAIDGIDIAIVSDADTQRMMFEQGESDVFNFDYAESQLQWFLDNGYQDQIVSGSRAGTYYFMFNTAIEPLNNVNVRKALQMAVDRQAILDALYAGEGKVLSAFIPEGVLSHNDDAPGDPLRSRAGEGAAGRGGLSRRLRYGDRHHGRLHHLADRVLHHPELPGRHRRARRDQAVRRVQLLRHPPRRRAAQLLQLLVRRLQRSRQLPLHLLLQEEHQGPLHQL